MTERPIPHRAQIRALEADYQYKMIVFARNYGKREALKLLSAIQAGLMDDTTISYEPTEAGNE